MSVPLVLSCFCMEKLTADVSLLHVKAAVISDTVEKWKTGVRVGRRRWQMSVLGKIRRKTDLGSHKTLWNYHINGVETLAGWMWHMRGPEVPGFSLCRVRCWPERSVDSCTLHDSSAIALHFSRSGLSEITAEWARCAEAASSVLSSRACFHLVETLVGEKNDFSSRQKFGANQVRR